MLEKFGHLHSIGIISLVLVLSSCELPGSKPKVGKKPKETPFSPGPAPNQAIDLKTSCGIDPTEDPAAVIFTQKFKSLNIVYEGQMLISYRVESEATLEIRSYPTLSSVTTTVKVNKVINKSTNVPIIGDAAIGIGAHILAAVKDGISESSSLPRKDWLQLTGGSNTEWKDLLCVAVGTKSVKTTSKGGNHDFTFTPGFANTLNPMASAEQFQKELGNGRTFNIIATVDRSDKPVNGTVVYKPVSPKTTFTDAITGAQFNISADSAWEVTTNFDTKDSRFGELINKTTFYVNHSKKRFEAIVQEDPPSELLGYQPPPFIMLPL